MHFEGDKEFSLSPSDLWAKLSDARFLVQCIPGLEDPPQAGPDSAAWTLRPGLAFMRGKLDIKVNSIEKVPDQLVRWRIHGKGIGSSNTVEVAMHFALVNGGTRVHWTADVTELGGLLKAVPSGLIKASAQKVINDVWAEAEIKLLQ
jgi:carbon monoxide dehydrogenase subunit G